MYETFFGLSKSPFSMTPDPSFLYATQSHQEAIAGLLYAIQQRKGFMVLSGDAGTGKTTVLSSVIASLSTTGVHFSWILNPTLNASEFLELALLDFGLTDIPASKALRIMELQKFLLEVSQRGETAVLVIDEAHKLRPTLLEEIRLLSNFESASSKLIQIVLAGQNELTDVLDRHDLRQLKQRIAVRVRLRPLEPVQVRQYMEHRWRKAGGTDLPFTPEAVAGVIRASAGIPRVINSICDGALLLAFAESTRSVNDDHVAEVVSDLNLEEFGLHQPAESAGRDGTSPNGSEHDLAPILPDWAGPPVALGDLHLPPPVQNEPEATMPSLARYMPPPPKRPLAVRWATRLGIPVRIRTNE